jgi:hypothetical protein
MNSNDFDKGSNKAYHERAYGSHASIKIKGKKKYFPGNVFIFRIIIITIASTLSYSMRIGNGE